MFLVRQREMRLNDMCQIKIINNIHTFLIATNVLFNTPFICKNQKIVSGMKSIMKNVTMIKVRSPSKVKFSSCLNEQLEKISLRECLVRM